MNFGKRTAEAEALRIVDRAIERGITVYDTANAYNDGESERILGRAIRGRRDRLLITTKVGMLREGGRPQGLSARVIHRAIDDSLRRLGTDYVDVYYLHVPDHEVPIEETLAAMGELREKGKIRAMGVSNYAAWQILEMTMIAGAPRPVISQVMYNLLVREIEIEYAAYTRRFPIHTSVYNPLAGGILSGRHRRTRETEPGSRFDRNPMYQARYWSDRFFDLVDAYCALANELGESLVDMSYAWLAGRAVVDSILVGPGSIEHLDAAIEGIGKVLPKDVCARIDAIHRTFKGTDASYVR